MISASTRLASQIRSYGQQERYRVSLRDLVKFGTNPTPESAKISCQFLHNELRVRYAKSIILLNALPGRLTDMVSVNTLRDNYVKSFDDLLKLPYPETAAQMDEFTESVRTIRTRLKDAIPLLARGFHEHALRHGKHSNEIMESGVKPMIDTFVNGRLSTDMLQIQHFSLVDDPKFSRPGYVGAIQMECNPAHVAEQAIGEATSICELTYGESPEVLVLGELNQTFSFPDSHLYYILFELLKNSLRATLEHHSGEIDLPPVKIIIAKGKEDITLKVHDKGGGIKRSNIDKIWDYFYTTANMDGISTEATEPSTATTHDAMAGYGFGLPVSRVYARYFGGDLDMLSMDGFGSDVYVYLNHLGRIKESSLAWSSAQTPNGK